MKSRFHMKDTKTHFEKKAEGNSKWSTETRSKSHKRCISYIFRFECGTW